MNRESLIDEEITSDRRDLNRTFKEIREAVEKAQSREDLTELYKQSVYMILMTHSTPLNEKDKEMKNRREKAEREFSQTVRMLNRQAKKLGLEAGYSEDWEKLATNGYKSEGESLEVQNTTRIARE